jgi:hypothetical protein
MEMNGQHNASAASLIGKVLLASKGYEVLDINSMIYLRFISLTMFKIWILCLGCHDKWVPVIMAWRVLRLRMEERPTDMEGSCEYIE